MLVSKYGTETPVDELRQAFLELKRNQGCTEEEAAAAVEGGLQKALEDGRCMAELVALLNAGADGPKGRGFTSFSQATIES